MGWHLFQLDVLFLFLDILAKFFILLIIRCPLWGPGRAGLDRW